MIVLTRLITAATALLLVSTNLTQMQALSTTSPQKTVVVTGATGRAGSRLIRQLLDQQQDTTTTTTTTTVIALVRNATKARSMFGTEEANGSLTILEADFSNLSSLESTLSSSPLLQRLRRDPNDDTERTATTTPCRLRLFLACGNTPDQVTLELNVARAITTLSNSDDDGGECFCVKLSTAQPLVENSIGVGAIHRPIEESLKVLYHPNRYAMLRPNIFTQMFDPSEGVPLLAVDLKSKECTHMYADSKISMIDVDDVAACAKSILTSDDPITDHGGNIYELTGPEAVGLSGGFSNAISSIQSSPFTITSRSIEEHIIGTGLPPAAVGTITPFLRTIGSYGTVTDTVQKLTGRPPKSISDFVLL